MIELDYVIRIVFERVLRKRIDECNDEIVRVKMSVDSLARYGTDADVKEAMRKADPIFDNIVERREAYYKKLMENGYKGSQFFQGKRSRVVGDVQVVTDIKAKS